jgi:hypothetical protein
MPTGVAHYRIHGLSARISAERPQLLDVIHRRLRHFAAASTEPPGLSLDFQVVADAAHHVVRAPAGPTRLVLEMTVDGLALEARYSDADDVLYMHLGEGIRTWVNAKQGSTIVSIARDHADRDWLLSHPLLTIVLVEGLRRHGFYSLHAAALSTRGQGLLIAGTSGCGKSTLALALARTGLAFLGDDTAFLTVAGQRVDVLAFPDEVDISHRTASFFPELDHLAHEPALPGRRKLGVLIEDVCHVEVVHRCYPAVVVLPRVANTATSVLREIDPQDVFVELVPNVLLTNPSTAQAHLDALAALVNQTRCYLLEAGRDLDATATQLRHLLDAT